MNRFARLVRQSRLLVCLYYLLDDWRAGRRLSQGRLETGSGSRHLTLDIDQSIAYIERVWNDYLRYAGRPNFGRVVAEIGPGDNFGVALLALAAGAGEIHCIDRYRPARDHDRQAAIYAALSRRFGLERFFDGAPVEKNLRSVIYYPGSPAERFFSGNAQRYDAILSRAVLEHLYDPMGALNDMAAALSPGGVMVHRIDLRDHGMFAGQHPLTFLTVPAAAYRRMTQHSGRPNRVLLPAYRSWLSSSHVPGEVRIVRLAGVDDEFAPSHWEDLPQGARSRALAAVKAIRPRIARPLDQLPDADLAVSGIVLTVRCAARRLDADVARTEW